LCGALSSPWKIAVTSSPFPALQRTLIDVGSTFTTSSGVSPPERASVARRRSSRSSIETSASADAAMCSPRNERAPASSAFNISNHARTCCARSVSGQVRPAAWAETVSTVIDASHRRRFITSSDKVELEGSRFLRKSRRAL
jgi:hypothetical protein